MCVCVCVFGMSFGGFGGIFRKIVVALRSGRPQLPVGGGGPGGGWTGSDILRQRTDIVQRDAQVYKSFLEWRTCISFFSLLFVLLFFLFSFGFTCEQQAERVFFLFRTR